MIKIRFDLDGDGPAGESVWAEDQGGSVAKVMNIPFFVDDVSLGDLIRFRVDDDGIRVFDGLVERKTRKAFLCYGEDGDPAAKYNDICAHFRVHNIMVEGACPGYAVMAWPIDADPEEVEQAVDTAPHLIDSE